MTDPPPRELDWPTRRWLLWGLVAILALAAGIFLIIWLTGGDDAPVAEDGEVGEQMEWSIELTDLTGDTVTLKGDVPLGFPTETWQNDFRVARSVDESFEWDLDLELPVPVVDVDEAGGCDQLNTLLAGFIEEGAASAEPGLWQARAFAQYAVNAMRQQECEIDENILSGL